MYCYVFGGNSLAVKLLSYHIANERMIVKEALIRNQERKTDSKRKQQGKYSGDSCSSAKKARKQLF